MKVYEKTEDGILMHSDTYLGLDYTSTNLKHWKYLKREKMSNGKYRYYYHDAELNKLEKEIDAHTYDMLDASTRYINESDNADRLKKNPKGKEWDFKTGKYVSYKKLYKNSDKKAAKALRIGKSLEMRRDHLLGVLRRKTIASIPRKVMISGAAFILNAIEKSFK